MKCNEQVFCAMKNPISDITKILQDFVCIEQVYLVGHLKMYLELMARGDYELHVTIQIAILKFW